MNKKRYFFVGGPWDGLIKAFEGAPDRYKRVASGYKEEVNSVDMIGRCYSSSIKMIVHKYESVQNQACKGVVTGDTETWFMCHVGEELDDE